MGKNRGSDLGRISSVSALIIAVTIVSTVPLLLRPLQCLRELLPPVANHPPDGVEVVVVVVEEAAVVVLEAVQQPLLVAAASRPPGLVQ
jgi:hypothetical protein